MEMAATSDDVETPTSDSPGVINAIDKSSVHRICSGQVILDLAIAVKELVENSLDAGATDIEIRLKEYGKNSLEVCDNGGGVSQSNFDALALKHHTSKLSSFDDLPGVKSFGFRGEALSSLCAMGEMLVCTRDKDAATGFKLKYDYGGNLVSTSRQAREQGTTVTVTNLFKSLPVRHAEFCRNLKREFAKVQTMVIAYALVSTHCRINCYNVTSSSRNLVVGTKCDSTLRDNIISIFGAKHASCLEKVELSSEYFAVEGYISGVGPSTGRRTSDRQFFFINNRPIDCPKIARQINSVFKGAVNPHHVPALVLNFIIKTGHFDVNVTPDKRTVYMHRESLLLESIKELFSQFYARDEVAMHPLGLSSSSRSSRSSTTSSGPSMSQMSIATYGVVAQSEARSVDEEKAANGVHVNGSSSSPVIDADLVAVVVAEVDDDSGAASPVEPAGVTSATTVTTPATSSVAFTLRSAGRPRPGDRRSRLDSNGSCSGNTISKPGPGAVYPSAGAAFSRSLRGGAVGAQKHTGRDSSLGAYRRGGAPSLARPAKGGTVGNPFSRYRATGSGDIGGDGKSLEDSPMSPLERAGDMDISVPGTEPADEVEVVEMTDGDERYLAERWDKSATEGGAAPEGRKKRKVGPHARARAHERNDLAVDISTDAILKQKERRKRRRVISGAKGEGGGVKTSVGLVGAINASGETDECGSADDKEGGSDKEGGTDNDSRFFTKMDQHSTKEVEDELRKGVSKEDFGRMEILGQFNLGFVIARRGNDVFIIDQHASDEKYNFESLQQNTKLKSQRLLMPKVVPGLTVSDELTLIDNIHIFRANGFDFDIDEGRPPGSKVKMLAYPFSKGTDFGMEDVYELIYAVKNSPGVMCRPSRVYTMNSSRACRMSIMIGTALNHEQLTRVVRHMGTMNNPWCCPHGRPTMRHMVDLRRLPCPRYTRGCTTPTGVDV
eukprot:TRINITY_DN12656_c0_g1_i1.p1 TRINITY_DN12656_c0_g1~~TRINITY_DN12656_c0_g1_i1.p1  ORF type:complete len:950 (-),score=186.26 TRINITY_DN12656_c0_g1_i1:28-2877(-)